MSGKISGYAALSSALADDVLPVVDVHDTTMASSGTTKKITVANLAVAATGTTILVPKPAGATATDTANITAAITSLTTALASGPATLQFQDGTYQADSNSLVFQSLSNFTIRGTGATVLQQAPNRAGNANNTSGNMLTFVSCADFSVTGLTVDGNRDTVAPVTPITAAVSAGQPSVTVAAGNGARYVAGERLQVFGGLGSGEQDQSDGFAGGFGMVIQSITPGGGPGGGDLIIFTGNLGSNYNTVNGSAISDGFGPYGCTGAYVFPFQTGNATVAGLTLQAEDQQCGIHLIRCSRFRIQQNTIRNLWESPLRCGTHIAGTAQGDGCTDGIISGNTLYHGYDQGIGLWCSSNVVAAENDINAGGWAGLCLTGASDCAFTGNTSRNNVQRLPGDNADGNGVAIEGGRRNLIQGNRIGGNYGPGIRLTALGTLPFGTPGQVATTIASGSNTQALPQATVNVGSTTGFAAAGQFTVLSSAGAQQVTYTGKSGTTFTGCTGGTGTLFTNERVTQYPLFLANGSTLAPGLTTLTVSDGTKFQVNGFYSIVDGGRTEMFTVTAIATNTLTLAEATAYWHPDKCQISQSIPEDTSISGNSISGPAALGGGDAGITLASVVRTSIVGNTIDRAGSRGIDGVTWVSGGLQPPVGTLVYGNTITTPDVINSGAFIQACAFQQCTDLSISGNHFTGIPGTAGGATALYLQACSQSVLSGNLVTDAYSLGISLDSIQDWPCKAVSVTGNEVLRCLGEGIKLFGGDSLNVANNTITYSAANGGPGGFGGGLNIRGVQNSVFSGNVVYNNGRGIGLDTASINSVNVATANNVFSGNIARDDGNNRDPYTGGATTQNFGFKELAAGQGPNTYVNNVASGNTTNWTVSSTGNTLRGNTGYNPVGKFGGQPAVPATTVAYTNILNADATAFITGGTVTVIAIGGQATGLTAGTFRVPAGQTITLTYSVAPTWLWFGD